MSLDFGTLMNRAAVATGASPSNLTGMGKADSNAAKLLGQFSFTMNNASTQSGFGLSLNS